MHSDGVRQKLARIYFENGTNHEVLISEYDSIKMVVQGNYMEAVYRGKRIYYNADQDNERLSPNKKFEGIQGNVVMFVNKGNKNV